MEGLTSALELGLATPTSETIPWELRTKTVPPTSTNPFLQGNTNIGGKRPPESTPQDGNKRHRGQGGETAPYFTPAFTKQLDILRKNKGRKHLRGPDLATGPADMEKLLGPEISKLGKDPNSLPCFQWATSMGCCLGENCRFGHKLTKNPSQQAVDGLLAHLTSLNSKQGN